MCASEQAAPVWVRRAGEDSHTRPRCWATLYRTTPSTRGRRGRGEGAESAIRTRDPSVVDDAVRLASLKPELVSAVTPDLALQPFAAVSRLARLVSTEKVSDLQAVRSGRLRAFAGTRVG